MRRAVMLLQFAPVVLVAAVLAGTDVASTPTPGVDWVDLAKALGFPTAVAGYLLFMMNSTIRENTKATLDLKGAVERLLDRLPAP